MSHTPMFAPAADVESTDWRSLALLLVGNVLFGAGLFVHAFLFNFYLRELQLPASAMGHQVAAMTLGGLCALLPAGAIIDRLGTRLTLVTGVALTVTGLALTALARHREAIYAAAFLTGVGAAACRVAWGPAIMRLTDVATRARVFTWNVAALIGSSAVWTFLAGVLRDRPLAAQAVLAWSPTRLILVAGAAVSALAGVCYALIGGLGAPSQPKLGSFVLPRAGRLRVLVPLVAVWMVAAALVLPFFNVFFSDVFALTVAEVGSIFASTQLFTAAALVGAAELARRWGPRRMLLAWMIAMAPALLLLSGGGPLWAAVLLYFIQGIVAPATNPLLDQLLLERAPRERHGIVASWRNAAAEGAGAFGASSGGRLLESSTFPVLFQVAAVVAALSSAALYAALRVTRAAAPMASDEPA